MKKIFWFLIFGSLVWSGCMNRSIQADDSAITQIENVAINECTKEETECSAYKNIADENIEQEIWSGISDGVLIRWTNKDIYIESSKGTYKFFSNYANQLFEKNYKYEANYSEKLKKYIWTNKKNEFPNCDIGVDGRIVSLVGSIITVQVEQTSYCGIPQYYSHWVVVDTHNPEDLQLFAESPIEASFIGKSLLLTNFFTDEQIVKALMKNQNLSETIYEVDKSFKPKSTQEVLEWLKKHEKEIPVLGNGDFGNLTKTFLTGFVFDRIENDKLIVHIQLDCTHKSHSVAFLELKFDVPEKLQKNLFLANSKQQGFLQKDALGISDDFSRMYLP